VNIAPNDLVLEIGSGHNPKVRADVLCDKYLLDDTERGGAIVADRPFVVGDAEALPFRDGAFDYVICTHVLEHAQDVERFIAELQRVATAGYIETPSEVGEWLYGWEYHRWLVNRIDGRLVLRRKTERGPFGRLFHEMGATDADFMALHRRYHHVFLVQHEWRTKIDYEVRDTGDAPFDLDDEAVATAMLQGGARPGPMSRVKSAIWTRMPDSWRAGSKGLLTRGARSARRRVDLRDVAACPRCKGSLRWESGAAHCEADGLSFEIRDGIPILLLPDEAGAA
jgi:uncharacterized protein YbaR (Trm112 family)